MAFGKYAVDYEQRIDYGRLRTERLQRAKDQIEKTELGQRLGAGRHVAVVLQRRDGVEYGGAFAASHSAPARG